MTGFILGILLLAAVLFARRLVQRVLPATRLTPPPAMPSEFSKTQGAILLVKPGGRLAYLNQEAREWFGLLGQEPNLERLARYTRPSQVFLEICAQPGKARFALQGKIVDGESFVIPYNGGSVTVISLRRPHTDTLSGQGEASQAIKIFNNFSQTWANRPDLQTTLRMILESAERLIPADLITLKLWDEESRHLIPYQLISQPDGSQRLECFPEMEKEQSATSPAQGKPSASHLVEELRVADRLVGILELASFTQDAFSPQDAELLRALCGQAAVALHYANVTGRAQEEQRRLEDLSGLAQLARQPGILSDPEKVFTQLVDGIQPLLEVKSLGFWIWDDARHCLDAQQPFSGFSAEFTDLYHIVVPPGSRAEAILLAQEMIVAEDAVQDERMISLGLHLRAQAADFHNTALAPLSYAGRLLGYLQAADKKDGAPFNQEDLRLLTVIAGQAAIILESARLANQRQISQALHRITDLISSGDALDKILTGSLKELANTLPAEVAALFLMEEVHTELQKTSPKSRSGALQENDERPLTGTPLHLHLESLVAPPEWAQLVERLNATETPPTEWDGAPRLTEPLRSVGAEQVPSLWAGSAEALQLRWLIRVPLVAGGRSLGEVWVGRQSGAAFRGEQERLIQTAAGQIASVVEQVRLARQTDESLRQRADQLSALARRQSSIAVATREIGATLEPERLLDSLHTALMQATGAESGVVLLFQPTLEPGAAPVVDLSCGEAHGPTLSALELQALEQQGALVIPPDGSPTELSGDPARWQSSAGGQHASTSLLLRLAIPGRLIGLAHLHISQFDPQSQAGRTALETAEALANQAAAALDNAQRYQIQRKRSDSLNQRLQALAEISSPDSGQSLDDTLRKIALAIQSTTPYREVVLETNAQGPGTGDQQQPGSLLRVEDQASWSVWLARETDEPLELPLQDTQGRLIGLLRAACPPGTSPDREAKQTLLLFANQAARLIEIHRNQQILAQRVEQAQAEMEAAQHQLAELQRHDYIQAKQIERLGSELHWVQVVGEAAQAIARLPFEEESRGLDPNFQGAEEKITSQPERARLYQALAQQLIKRLEMEVVLVAEQGPQGPRLVYLAPVERIGAELHPEALLGQRNPLLSCLASPEKASSQITAVADLQSSPEWQNSVLLQALGTRAFICFTIPQDTGAVPSERLDNPETAVLAVRGKPLPDLDRELITALQILARQSGQALQNLRLRSESARRLQEVHLLLEFTRQLGSLDPQAILRTLIASTQSLVPAAQAAYVALAQADQGKLELVPQAAIGYSNENALLAIRFSLDSPLALPAQAYIHKQSLRVDEVDFAHQYPLPAADLARYREAARGRLPVSSMIILIGDPTTPRPQTGGMGVLVLENYAAPAAFSSEDQALVASLARQTALALENARLYQAAEGRLAHLQALTEVAAALASSLDSGELVASLLDHTRLVIPYDTATLWLRSPASPERLTVQAVRGFQDSEQRLGLSVMIGESLLLREIYSGSGRGGPISVPDVRQDPRFPALMDHRHLSWLGVPLIAQGELMGVIALEKTEPYAYTPEHLQAIATFAGQASVALQNARLYQESLSRATELDRRAQRLAVLNRLSTSLSASLETDYLLQLTLQELLLALDADGGSAILFDAAGENLLQAEIPLTTGELPVILPNAPLFDHLRQTLGVLSISEHETSELLAPLEPYLTDRNARSLLILPLATGNDLHGLLLVHHNQPKPFSPEEVELARTISNQAAVAVQNAALFQETQLLFTETRQRSAELATLFELGVHIAQELDRQKLIDLSFENILHLLQLDPGPGEAVGLALFNEEGQLIVQRQGPETDQRPWEAVLASGQPILVDEPAQAGVPLVVRGAVTGALFAQSAEPGHFGEAHLRLLGQIANQLAVALDNARLFSAVQGYAAGLEERVSERTAQLAREHQRTQTLLGIITELSTSLDMDIVLNRTLALINETTGAEHSMIILVLPDEPNLYLRATLGYPTPAPKGGLPTSLMPDQGLAGWVISQRQPVQISDLWQDPRWNNPPLTVPDPAAIQQHRSALAVPLMMGEEVLGALLLFHNQVDRFSASQLDLVQATAKQIAVAINNAQLYTLIRDQAERLGEMLRRQHIETSRSQAILEAVADGVLVTDSSGTITLFNASAERILGLRREVVIGQSLEQFLGLFGKAAQTWIDTIHRWSLDPASISLGESEYAFGQQIELEDARVVSVQLSPVRLRNDFLGTVSTFRDITHQIVVDRLKSEFVATVSHELRTPMTSIKGYVEILLMGAAGELSPQQTRFLDIVKSNTERLAILVNDLLDISRIEAGRVILALQPLDMRQLAREAVADLEQRNQEEHKEMHIQLSLPGELPRVLGDAERVHQILDNLLDNAYAYTPAGGHIQVRLSQIGDEVQVEVQDDGIGIHPQDQPRIFERFYRGEDPLVLSTSGTGLGLSIVRHLVEMHKGRIWLKSSGVPGEGSIFGFTLPVYHAEDV